MNLHRLLNARQAAGKPVRVALIGAGKFGSMFLSQVPHTPGLEVPLIIDIDRDRAREACRRVGWNDVAAVRDGHIYEIKSAYILQPGPAALTEGLRQLHGILSHVRNAMARSG